MKIIPIMMSKLAGDTKMSKFGKIELHNNIISVSTNYNEYSELDGISTAFPLNGEVTIDINTMKRNKKYIFLINTFKNFVLTNFAEEFNTYYYENMMWTNGLNLYEIKVWYTDADELFIYSNFEIESETIDFQIYDKSNGEDPTLKNLYQVIKHNSQDPKSAELYNKESIYILRRMVLNNKLRPASSLAYMDIQVDFILTFINFLFSYDKNIADSFFEKYPEYQSIFNKMMDLNILKLKTNKEAAATLRRKEIARDLQKNYYDEVVSNAEENTSNI